MSIVSLLSKYLVIIMIKISFLSIILISIILGCTKVDVPLDELSSNDNLSIIYYDNYPVKLSTYKTDSFITSGNGIFTIGYHRDSAFGTAHAASYTELNLPSENPLKNKNVIFDSIELILKTKGLYYGDTTIPIRFIVQKLAENIKNNDEGNTSFSNARTFITEPQIIGELTTVIKPTKDSLIRIRLSNAIGEELIQKFKSNSIDIQNQTNFIKYLKGFRIGVDTGFSNTVFYFSTPSNNAFMCLYYRVNGVVLENKRLDFSINTMRQFNFIRFNNQNTLLSVFTNFKKELKESQHTGNKAFLNNNMGSYIKIEFPSLLSLNELHPYVQVKKAELLVKPSPGSYNKPYKLPNELYLYTTDDSNNPISQLKDASGQTVLTGNLKIDNLYGINTTYSYDITGFIQSVIDEGKFSKSALLLVSPTGLSDKSIERLIVNDQSLNNSIQLKLYVLGL